jgi:hypothetical protein
MVLTAGCVKLGESSELPLAAVEATPVPGDRINCSEILGTAFRSDNERQWFMDNCSKWPLVKVADEGAPAPGQTQAPAEPPECAQIRGKPYESNQQRNWYLQNCNQGSSAPRAGTTPTPSSQQNQQQTQTTGGPDRTDCNAIRGTAYRSAGERTWYIQNCSGSTQQQSTQTQTQPQTTGGPDRTDCNAIRGTAYRSPAEQLWYNANCRN